MAKLWTKRSVLSTVATIFDPNGWIAPVIFWAKYFLQRLWIAEISWDEPITGDLLTDWLGFLNRLESITQVSIPRHFLPSGKYKASLHGFCDASVSGYAAVVYLRTVKRDGTTAVHLVTAKSKVAPLRTRLSIPKLELSGAALLTRLLNHVISTLGKLIELSEVYAWSDSQIVLAWLQASPHRLEVFVANRVSQIQASEVKLIWRHVPGELNPADVASRGCDAPTLVDHSLWWGPKWLADPVSTWPPTTLHGTESLPGIRIAAVETEATPSDPLLARYSTLNKLLGVTGWIHRFIRNCRKVDVRDTSPSLSADERRVSLMFWFNNFNEYNKVSKQILLTAKVIKTGIQSEIQELCGQ
ncbi:unnamed protein product [Arctia plantaginis]|uniref:Uncharacterized protein n=1 Tax=Arctia plantaginis TaxID=874455 RepID=A0A8S1AFY9_ARCPL|nr:unnamed protein product [Arctia plantaginis]